MLSQKLETTITSMEAMAVTLVQREAADDLRTELRDAAGRQACLRCDKAGFVVLWNSDPKEVERHQWLPALVSCGAFHALPQHLERFGLDMPAPQFFCTGETAGSTGGAVAAGFDDFNAASFATRALGQREGEQRQRGEREVAR